VSVQPPPPQGANTPPPAAHIPPVAQPGPAPGVRYSSRAGRFIAYVVDGFVIGILVGIPYFVALVLITLGAGGDNRFPAVIGAVILVIALLVGLAYRPWMWSRGGQTVGYMVMRLKVVRAADGGPLSGGQAIGRFLGYIISAAVFYLGFIWILFDAKRQGWHDKLANTVVIEV